MHFCIVKHFASNLLAHGYVPFLQLFHLLYRYILFLVDHVEMTGKNMRSVT